MLKDLEEKKQNNTSSFAKPGPTFFNASSAGPDQSTNDDSKMENTGQGQPFARGPGQ